MFFHSIVEIMSHIVNPVLGQPVEGLEEEQDREQGYELGIEVVPEHGKSQTRLRQGVPERNWK